MNGDDNTMTIAQAQRDVRFGHLCGATGMLVSGALWVGCGVAPLAYLAARRQPVATAG